MYHWLMLLIHFLCLSFFINPSISDNCWMEMENEQPKSAL